METQRQPLHSRIQKRHILVFIINLVAFSMHTMRNTALDTIKFYVDHPKLNKSNNLEEVCNVTNKLKLDLTPVAARRDVLYTWDEQVVSQLVTAFYASLHATHILGGYLSDTWNPKIIMLVSLGGQTVMTLLMPLVIQNLKGNWKILLGWNVIHGLIQGPIYPTIFSVLGQWVPSGEKTIAIGLMNGTMSVAYVTFELIGALLINAIGHWSAIFYIFGCFGVLTNLLWFFLCFPYPESHPKITPEEIKFIRRKIGPHYSNKKKIVPWIKMANSMPFWTLVLNFMAWGWAWYTIAFEYPKYMRTVLELDYARHYLQILVIPNIWIFISYTLGGWVCDRLIKRQIVDITTLRKIYNNLGSMGTNSFAVAGSYAHCNQALPVNLYSVILSFMALFYTGAMVYVLDLAPNFGGIIYGFAQTAGHILLYVRPLATAKLISENNLVGWESVFWFSFGVCAIANLIYALFCKATEASWNLPQDLHAKNEIDRTEQT